VYDKTVRRRRALLVLLVVLSLLLLTAYFGESPNGRLHGVQRDFLTVVAPLQDGANKALKPVRDLFGWFNATLNAKSQRNRLLKENERLRKEVVAEQAEKRTDRELTALVHLDRLGVGAYRPVTATVVSKSPNIWYSTVDINAGSGDGVAINDPVINGEGLVGRIGQVASDGSQVDLITDSTMGVMGRLAHVGAVGLLQPKVGEPKDLLMQYLATSTQPASGEYVVTSGTVAPGYSSLYPPGLVIGEVTSVNEESAYKSVNVRPTAELENLDTVQVLTITPGSAPAKLVSLTSSLPAGQSSSSEASSGEQLASTGSGG